MSNIKQQSLLDDQNLAPPATEVMKKVAAATADGKKMKKSFSPDEIEEIILKRDNGEKLKPEEGAAVRDQYRKIKHFVKEAEIKNRDKLYVFPALTNGDGWYKVIETSALYYVYRLAPRMGRSAKIYPDMDKAQKAVNSASFQNIEKFVEQFKQLEGPNIEITIDGVYIFTLKAPISDDELVLLRHAEEMEREKMHNVLKPKRMNPAVYQQILMISRQVVPRTRKLAKEYYDTIGEDIVRSVHELLAHYSDYSDELISKEEFKLKTTRVLNRMSAGVIILSENRIWQYDISTLIGTNIADLKRLVEKDFDGR